MTFFPQTLPNKNLCLKNDSCKNEKHPKERLTMFLCCNKIGNFQKIVVKGYAVKPWCFKNMNIKKLSIMRRHKKKAWMTQFIMTEWQIQLNKELKKQKCKFLL